MALLHEVKGISDETFINKMIKKKTHLGSDLVAALAGLNVDDFSHVGWCGCALQVLPLASSVFPRMNWPHQSGCTSHVTAARLPPSDVTLPHLPGERGRGVEEVVPDRTI